MRSKISGFLGRKNRSPVLGMNRQWPRLVRVVDDGRVRRHLDLTKITIHPFAAGKNLALCRYDGWGTSQRDPQRIDRREGREESRNFDEPFGSHR